MLFVLKARGYTNHYGHKGHKIVAFNDERTLLQLLEFGEGIQFAVILK